MTPGALRRLWARFAHQPAALGVAAILAVAGWQAATVQFNYQGDYTALFCTGASWVLPPELDKSTYRFANSNGYDGQFYRLVAHDPWMAAGYLKYADAPAVRWRRILAPAAAWVLAAGVSHRIDFAYMLVLLLCHGLGVYALSRWLVLRGRPAAGGLLFLLLPGTLVCIDRLTVDVSLYALLFLCLLWDEEGKSKAVWCGLALCALTRDIGFLIIAAFILAEASAHRFRRAAILLTAALPAAAWYLWVRITLMHTPGVRTSREVARWAFKQSGYGILLRMMNPVEYDLPAAQALLASILDEVALAGMIAGVVLTIVLFRRRNAGKLEWVGLVFAGLFFVASSQLFWLDLFSWPRAFTPMFAALGFGAIGGARRWLFVPMAAVTLRVGLQFGPQIEGVIRALR